MLFRELNYVSLKALQPIEDIVEEASAALTGQKRTIRDSRIAPMLAAVSRAGKGEGITFRAIMKETGRLEMPSQPGWIHWSAFAADLYDGLFIWGAYILFFFFRKKGVQQQEKKLYQKVSDKQAALKTQLQFESGAPPERIEYLKGLCSLLTLAAEDLKEDLGL